MGKRRNRKRRLRNVGRLYEQDQAQEAQERQLDVEGATGAVPLPRTVLMQANVLHQRFQERKASL